MTTTEIPNIPWTRCQDMLIHNGKGYSIIQNLARRKFVEFNRKEEFFNTYQWFLLQRCLKGLRVYSTEELRYLSHTHLEKVKRIHILTIKILNEYCQQVLISLTNEIVKAHLDCLNEYGMFMAKILLTNKETDPKFKVQSDFKDLGITPVMVAKKLVDKRCLPDNYFALTLADDPRLIKLKKVEQIDEL